MNERDMPRAPRRAPKPRAPKPDAAALARHVADLEARLDKLERDKLERDNAIADLEARLTRHATLISKVAHRGDALQEKLGRVEALASNDRAAMQLRVADLERARAEAIDDDADIAAVHHRIDDYQGATDNSIAVLATRVADLERGGVFDDVETRARATMLELLDRVPELLEQQRAMSVAVTRGVELLEAIAASFKPRVVLPTEVPRAAWLDDEQVPK